MEHAYLVERASVVVQAFRSAPLLGGDTRYMKRWDEIGFWAPRMRGGVLHDLEVSEADVCSVLGVYALRLDVGLALMGMLRYRIYR